VGACFPFVLLRLVFPMIIANNTNTMEDETQLLSSTATEELQTRLMDSILYYAIAIFHNLRIHKSSAHLNVVPLHFVDECSLPFPFPFFSLFFFLFSFRVLLFISSSISLSMQCFRHSDAMPCHATLKSNQRSKLMQTSKARSNHANELAHPRHPIHQDIQHIRPRW
jgi:hypothetical protein